MISPIIRPIASHDNAELAQLIRSVLKEFKANKPGTAYFDEETAHLYEVFQRPNSAYWVVELEGKIIGGGGIYPTNGLPADTCELVKLYLYPEARGLGLGKAIIQKCLEAAKAFGYRQIYLESMPELNQAVSLYERLGFKKLSSPLGNSGHFGCDIWMAFSVDSW
ncbi:MAG: GNAT family N-acetyltransferase [Pedobacter sp.]|nr:GNAT family N-acetyltransferase [Pedobacter sp.]MDQ8053606.1 GNAT family N-acetyltransferase [Pedobacter sp.]